MKWVDSCGVNEAILESPDIHNLKVCRRMEYHVNPASESILELGTRTNPYKNINLVIFELFNFMKNTDAEITVKLSKSSEHFLMHHQIALYNITNVVFEPYNSNQKIASNDEFGMQI